MSRIHHMIFHVILKSVNMWTTRVIFEEFYYVENNQKIADKKKTDYQEILQKSSADSAEWSRDRYMKDPEKNRARSRESYKKDPEKGRADSAA